MTWRVLTEDGRERYASRIMENATMAAVAWSSGQGSRSAYERTQSLHSGDLIASGLDCHVVMANDETGEWIGFNEGRLVSRSGGRYFR